MRRKVSNLPPRAVEIIDAGPLTREQSQRVVEILTEGVLAYLRAEGKQTREDNQDDVGPLDKNLKDMYNYGYKAITTNRRTNGKEDNNHSRRRPLLLSLGENPQDEEAKPESDPRIIDS